MNTAEEIKEGKKKDLYVLLTEERRLLSTAQVKVVDWTGSEGEFLQLRNAITQYKREIKELERQLDKI